VQTSVQTKQREDKHHHDDQSDEVDYAIQWFSSGEFSRSLHVKPYAH
jgi:hypothetical protein